MAYYLLRTGGKHSGPSELKHWGGARRRVANRLDGVNLPSCLSHRVTAEEKWELCASTTAGGGESLTERRSNAAIQLHPINVILVSFSVCY